MPRPVASSFHNHTNRYIPTDVDGFANARYCIKACVMNVYVSQSSSLSCPMSTPASCMCETESGQSQSAVSKISQCARGECGSSEDVMSATSFYDAWTCSRDRREAHHSDYYITAENEFPSIIQLDVSSIAYAVPLAIIRGSLE